jgi:hypothetical protein
MACTSGCRTRDHASYGECLRSKAVRTPAMEVEDLTTQKKADKSLDAYAAARKVGIQPASTRPGDVTNAVRVSDMTGQAYKA